jgi:5-exo-hydroxycamphor dehydrogenase
MRIGGATFPKPRHYHDAVHLAARVQDRYPLERLITHRFAIRDASSALHAVEKGVAIKAVIDPSL